MQDAADILAVHPGALGDVVLFSQLLSALARRAGGRVRLAAGGEKAALLAGLAAVEEALDFDALAVQEVFSDRPVGQCRLPLQLGRCDLLVSCLAAGDERAQRRLAELASADRAIFLPVRPPTGFAGHLVEHWAALAGLDSVHVPQWNVPQEWRSAAMARLEQAEHRAGGPFVLIHPGSGSREKCWPLERFIELAAALTSSGQAAPVFVLGPTELDWWGASVAEGIAGQFPVVVCPPLTELAGLCSECEAMVGNDSGPSHLAAAVGARTVALFGPTDPANFSPRGRSVRVIHSTRLPDILLTEALAAIGMP